MKAAIYNPYLDTLGGGERYTMGIASLLKEKGYEVDVQWKDKAIRNDLEKRFGIDLTEINFVSDIKKGEKYDLCFWVSDGSIPLLRARNNILHFQIPFINVDGSSLINKMKLFRVSHIVCNSKFTKQCIDKEYNVKSIVIYPPVDTNSIKPKRKKDIILAVGRFSQLIQAKNQNVLIKAFKTLVKKGLGDFRLILAGGSEIGGKEYLEMLRKHIKGFPIDIVENPSYKALKELYGYARIFWAASGFGVDEKKEPQKVEHFGIATVEAMSAKTIPLVYDAGGYREIIIDGVNGYLWHSVSQLATRTIKLVNEAGLMRTISNKCYQDSKRYSYERFKKEFLQII